MEPIHSYEELQNECLHVYLLQTLQQLRIYGLDILFVFFPTCHLIYIIYLLGCQLLLSAIHELLQYAELPTELLQEVHLLSWEFYHQLIVEIGGTRPL